MGVPVVTLAAPKDKPLHAWNVGKGMNTVAGLADLIAHSEDEVDACDVCSCVRAHTLIQMCVCVCLCVFVCKRMTFQRHPRTMRICVWMCICIFVCVRVEAITFKFQRLLPHHNSMCKLQQS